MIHTEEFGGSLDMQKIQGSIDFESPCHGKFSCLHNDKRRYNLVSWTMDDEFFVVDVHVIIICCCYYC